MQEISLFFFYEPIYAGFYASPSALYMQESLLVRFSIPEKVSTCGTAY